MSNDGGTPADKFWFSGDHFDDHDIIRQHQIHYSGGKNGVTETVRVVIVHYNGGESHEFEEYGYRVKTFVTEDNSFLPDLMVVPFVETFLGEVDKIDKAFMHQLKGIVNEHTGLPIYTFAVPLGPSLKGTGAPHR
jgi:hypothetical protein